MTTKVDVPEDDGRRRRIAKLVEYAGTCPDMMTVDELQALRREQPTADDPDSRAAT